MSLYDQCQTAVTFTNLIPFIEIHVNKFGALIQKRIWQGILFLKVISVLKSYIYVCMLHAMITFIAFHIIDSFSSKWKPQPTKYHKSF